MINRLLALLAVALLTLGACGSDDDDSETSTDSTTTVADGDAADSDSDSDTVSDDDDSSGSSDSSTGIGTCSSSQVASAGAYAVSGIAADDPDGGLVARVLPGAGEDERGVLTEGTVVDTTTDADACAVTSDGAVWWDIGTAQLATGGWVNATFLKPLGSPVDTDQDSYDVEKAQVACIYEGDGGACDLLVQDGMTEDDNYGLGNSYSMAPDDAINQQCLDGDSIACAEQEARKGGGE